MNTETVDCPDCNKIQELVSALWGSILDQEDGTEKTTVTALAVVLALVIKEPYEPNETSQLHAFAIEHIRNITEEIDRIDEIFGRIAPLDEIMGAAMARCATHLAPVLEESKRNYDAEKTEN